MRCLHDAAVGVTGRATVAPTVAPTVSSCKPKQTCNCNRIYITAASSLYQF